MSIHTRFAALALFLSATLLSAPAAQAQKSGPKVLARGEFHKVEESARGKVTVTQSSDGKRVLRLSNFETASGPDLHVRLIAADDARDTASVAKTASVDLGKLKSNKGAQSYELPGNLDLGKYRLVSIWCIRYTVNFAVAPLKAAR